MPTTRYALSGQTALVSGGGRGIGRAIALGLGQAGAHVAINYVRDAGAAGTVVADIERDGGRAIAVQADVSDPGAVERLLDRTEESLGRVEIVVNNAAVLRRTPFLEIGVDEWEWILRTNLLGCFLLSQAAARRMVRYGIRGRIVNISSHSARYATPGLAHYAASKSGMAMLTRSMAFELAAHGICVNDVRPGLVETDMNRDEFRNPADRQVRIDRIPLHQIGSGEDIAAAVLFLASRDAGHITGATIVVDGGSGLRGPRPPQWPEAPPP